jgi:hypothetical protein
MKKSDQAQLTKRGALVRDGILLSNPEGGCERAQGSGDSGELLFVDGGRRFCLTARGRRV